MASLGRRGRRTAALLVLLGVLVVAPEAARADLQIHVDVVGNGSVRGFGLDCGPQSSHGECTATAIAVSSYTVTATPSDAPGWSFTGWSGAGCGTSPTCVIPVPESGCPGGGPVCTPSTSVTATFERSGEPVTRITGGPTGRVRPGTHQLLFGAEPGALLRCRTWATDAPAPAAAPCSSPLAVDARSEGRWRLEVYATDAFGAIGPVAAREWEVDGTPPETGIVDGPGEGATTLSTAASFRFESEPGATYECAVDGGPWGACADAIALTGLGAGEHRIAVRAIDAAGNADLSPAVRRWTIGTDPALTDRDRDGVLGAHDCRDEDAAIRPGAHDKPGDGIDQDCDGRDAPFRAVSVLVTHQWGGDATRSWPLILRLDKLPANATVTVRCGGRGRGCPFKRRVIAVTGKPLNLKPLFRGRKLKPGARLKIVVSAPDMTAKVLAFRMRRGRQPAGGELLCRPPGTRKAKRC